MSDKWPSPSPRDEVLSRVVTRGLRIRLINRVVAVALAVSAVGAGVAVGYSGILPFGTAAPVTGGSLPYYLCPATGEAGEFHHGDRVLVTGVDASGNWLQVRDPAALERRVWVQREAVDPDSELDTPVAECSTDVRRLEVLVPEESTTTTLPEGTTTTVPEETTTTTVPATTTSTAGPTTTTRPQTTTTTTPATTTTTTAPAAPVVASVSANPGTIKEQWSGICVDGSFTSTITAQVSNATSVTMSWDVGPQPRSTEPEPIDVDTYREVHDLFWMDLCYGHPYRLSFMAVDEDGNELDLRAIAGGARTTYPGTATSS